MISDEDYLSRSDIISREMRRIADLMDQRAEAIKKGVSVEGSLDKKLSDDLHSVAKRLDELEQEKWGA